MSSTHDRIKADLRAQLTAAAGRARARWPRITLDPDRFATLVGDRLAGDPGAAHLEQLFLARACAGGDPGALAAFEEELGPVIDSALARMSLRSADADEVKQRLREKLFVPAADRPPRIADYAGRGDLRGWVRAAAVRTALNYLRDNRRDGIAGDAELAAVAAPASDPALAHLRDQVRADTDAAFGEARSALADRDRAVLRYHYAEKLTIDQIGAIYGVHKTTAFRWLERARELLVRGAREALERRLKIEGHELDSLVREVASQLDLTLRHHFLPDP
jgi:RNA polymerase sigma-70 factor, ECF subfamily